MGAFAPPEKGDGWRMVDPWLVIAKALGTCIFCCNSTGGVNIHYKNSYFCILF
jgi:hypothetical protein